MSTLRLSATACAVLAFAVHAAAAEYGAPIAGKHGFTHTSPALQNDVNTMMHNAVPVLVMRALGQPAIACGRMDRIDTVVTQMVSPQQWSETWTYHICATKIAIPIDFRPDGHGGAYFTLRTKDDVIAPMAPL